jgi:hypothetical protein
MRALLLLLLLPVTALAAPSIKASVDRTELRLNERLTVEVTLVSERVGFGGPGIQEPDLKGFVSVGRVSFSRYDSRSAQNVKTLQLTLQPVRVGALTIGAFRFPQQGGAPLTTEPIEITVQGAQAAPPANRPTQPNTANQVPAAPETPGDEVAFLRWEVDHTQLWLGEQIRAQLVLYVNRELGVRDFEASDVNPQGFWKVERNKRTRARLVQFGQKVYAAESIYDQQLFPLRAGMLKLPAVDTTMTVSTRSFGRRRSQRVQRRAEALALTIKRLPSQGRPANFAGPAVGRVRIEAQSNRTKVKAEDGLQLTITTRVEGLIENVPEVQLPDVPGLRIFPPAATTKTTVRGDTVSGLRRQTWLIKPTKTGRIKIPAVSLPWFSPKHGAYRTARSRPVHLNITGTPRAAPSSDAAVAGDDAPKLRSVRAEVDLSPAHGAVHRAPLFYLVIFVPPLAFFGLLLAGRMRSRRDASAGSRAARRAGRDALAALDAAKAQPPSKAYGAIAHALETFLSTRFERPFKGLTHGQLSDALAALGVPAGTATELIEELENCDFARFAPGSDSGDVAAAAARATKLINAIEQAPQPSENT